MTSRYAQEMQAVRFTCKISLLIYTNISLTACANLQIDELLKQRNEIHASYTTVPPMKRSSSKNRSRGPSREVKEDAELREKKPARDKPKKKKWFNIHLKVDKRKAC